MLIPARTPARPAASDTTRNRCPSANARRHTSQCGERPGSVRPSPPNRCPTTPLTPPIPTHSARSVCSL
jgi:hypothetical protein